MQIQQRHGLDRKRIGDAGDHVELHSGDTTLDLAEVRLSRRNQMGERLLREVATHPLHANIFPKYTP